MKNKKPIMLGDKGWDEKSLAEMIKETPSRRQIYNPVTRAFYLAKVKSVSAKNKASILNRWKPLEREAWEKEIYRRINGHACIVKEHDAKQLISFIYKILAAEKKRWAEEIKREIEKEKLERKSPLPEGDIADDHCRAEYNSGLTMAQLVLSKLERGEE